MTLRCNNREFLFDDLSQEMFVRVLQDARRRFPIRLYNYCLMTNHVHLLFRVEHEDTLSKTMHWISTIFSHRFNRWRGRVGHLWQGRFRSTIIEESTYFFRCMAYVDLNPLRAGIVASPSEYIWSGHRAVREENAAHIDLHRLYLAAGADPAARYRFYCNLLAQELDREPVPLAETDFVGNGRFLATMRRRFQLDVSGASLRRKACGKGLFTLGPEHGGQRSKRR